MLSKGNYLILLQNSTSASIKYGSWGVDGVALVDHFQPERSEWALEHLPDGHGISIQSVFTKNYLASRGDGGTLAFTPHPYGWTIHPTGSGHYLIQTNSNNPPVLNWNLNADKTHVVTTSHLLEHAVTWVIKPVEKAA